jgi:hypothetical protein
MFFTDPLRPSHAHHYPHTQLPAEFKAGKLKKVTFKYGFPQYSKPAGAASKQAGLALSTS